MVSTFWWCKRNKAGPVDVGWRAFEKEDAWSWNKEEKLANLRKKLAVQEKSTNAMPCSENGNLLFRGYTSLFLVNPICNHFESKNLRNFLLEKARDLIGGRDEEYNALPWRSCAGSQPQFGGKTFWSKNCSKKPKLLVLFTYWSLGTKH